jgi:hypothetical protein
MLACVDAFALLVDAAIMALSVMSHGDYSYVTTSRFIALDVEIHMDERLSIFP